MRAARVIMALTLAISATVASGRAATADAPALPKLVVAEPTKDFGTVVPGTDLTHTFVLRNEGKAPLEVRELQPHMNVTIKSFDAVVAPGKTGTIVASLDALRIFGAGQSFVDVLSNDPDQPTLRLGLSANVEPIVVSKPGYARWIYVQREGEGMIAQLISAKDGQPFKVLGVDTPVPYLRATFRPATDAERNPAVPGSQWRVELRLDPEAAVGPIEGQAVVKTNHPKQSVVAIPLSGFVRPRYFLEPTKGDLGALTLATPQTFAFSLRNFATAPVEITGVETTIPGVTATSAAVLAGHRFSISVRLDPAVMAAGPFQGKLVVRLSDPLQPSLELPLSGQLLRIAASG